MFDSDGTGAALSSAPPDGDGTLRALRIGDVALHSRLRIRSRTRMTDTRTSRAGPAAPSLSAAAWLFCPRTSGQGSSAAVPKNAGGPTQWLRRGTRTNAGSSGSHAGDDWAIVAAIAGGDFRGELARALYCGDKVIDLTEADAFRLAGYQISYGPRLPVGFRQIATDLRIRLVDRWRASRRTP